jgi:ATP-dependent helicase/nuclease subunit A
LKLGVLLEASANPDSALGKALATATVVAADQTFKDVIDATIKKRDKVEAWIKRAGSIDAAVAEISQSFGLNEADSVEAICRECETTGVPSREWKKLAALYSNGKKFDELQAARWLRVDSLGWPSAIDAYLSLFLRDEDNTSKGDAYLMGKELRKEHPSIWEKLDIERARAESCHKKLRAVRTRDRSSALVTIAAEVIKRYAAEKDRRALLDYDDLIDKTLDLFARSSAAWVLYKLDLGIDHVLIDEAQDTNPKQWSIVTAIVSEFTPGGARPNVRRTVFAVGDEKQSIFSFQGAAPKEFDTMRRHFARQFDNEEQGWRDLKFQSSFRSGVSVLGAVDRVFEAPDIFASITSDTGGVPPHEALPSAAPGLVELWWPPLKSAERKEMEGWDAPFDTESEESPRVLLARKIAGHVKRWMAAGLKAGEVLVLVRQRGPLFEAIIRALKAAEIPVAGADRLVLTEHIAVMDLMALADCLLLPEDGLALASVLKSPLFGISEEQLFELAWNRKDTLRESLRGKANDDMMFAAADSALNELAGAAQRMTPFGFFAHVLGALRGRQKILARLGPEANDALDEFLNLALDYETRRTPSLQGFINWLRAARAEVRRDMEMARDEVRVMTVHGAKGLEANTVILADTTTKPGGPKDPPLLELPGGALVWGTARGNDVGPMPDARAKAQKDARDEYRRLLYVAMTRAAERLVICGTQGVNKIPDGCWYQLVEETLKPDSVSEPADDGDGEVWRYRKGDAAAPVTTTQAGEKTTEKKIALPPWLKANAAPDRAALRTITPSSADDEDAARPPITGASELARLRGTLAHRLVQSLPDIPADRRRAAAQDYLARRGKDLAAEDRARLAEQVMLILEDPRFYELYGPGSRAEVPIVGRLALSDKTVRVSGQIDRLAVTQDAVLIADFKTNRPAPRRIDDVLPVYIRQLALYRAVLAKLYPDKAIRAALVWTEVPDLMELSAELMDAAIARITPA